MSKSINIDRRPDPIIGCEMMHTRSCMSFPSARKESSWTSKASHYDDTEESSQPSSRGHSESVVDVTKGDACAILGTSKVNFSLSKCNVILSLVTALLTLVIGYKWSGFLIALIIFIALLIHVLVIWWLNDEGYFFPERPTSTAEDDSSQSVTSSVGADKPTLAYASEDVVRGAKDKRDDYSNMIPTRRAHV